MRRTPLLYWLLILTLMIPAAARATGSASVPNTIAALAGSPATNPASLLDANWTALVNYINAREVSIGTLTARPSAGTSGRWYFASDQNGGILYGDTGATWTQFTPPVNASAGYGSRGLFGATATATNTTYNVSADMVVLRSPSDQSVVVRTATATLSNDILTSGPTANARDQSAAFSVSTWAHFYYIWNGSTLATLSSLCAPSTTTGSCPLVGGPNLPATYTHWSYIGAVRIATAGTLNATFIRGAQAYPTPPYVIRTMGLGTGAEETRDVSAMTPPNNTCTHISLQGSTAAQNEIRYQANGPAVLSIQVNGTATTGGHSDCVPLAAQTIISITTGAANQGILLTGYKIPNGGE